MADFSFNSDTDDSAVDQILAEAMDDIVLKQVAAINCSSFSHSTLPSHLETRFQRLKTFPSSSKPLNPNSETRFNNSTRDKSPSGFLSSHPDSSSSSSGRSNFSSSKPQTQQTNDLMNSVCGSKKKISSGFVSSPSDSSISSSGQLCSPKSKAKSGDLKVKDGKFSSGSFSFRSGGSDSRSDTEKVGCFWCSPKKGSKKKSVKRDTFGELGLDWGEHDEILGDLKSFSSKEQKTLMKKAMKEEEKINKEAEKIVKWAKQASARFDSYDIDDEYRDDDDCGHNSGLH